MHSQATKHIIIVGIATLVSGVFNYLVHPLAVRILTTLEFGEFASLMSMMNIVGFIMSAGSIVTLKLIAQHHSATSFMYYLKHKLQWPLIGIGVMCWVIVSICSPWIAQSLHIDSHIGIIIMGASLITSLYGIILSAILQSGGWFESMSITGIVGSLVRLVCVAAIGWWIGGTISMIGAIVVASLLGFALTEYIVRRHLGRHTSNQLHQHDGILMQELKHQSHSYLNLILITVMIGILTNSDVLIAQHIFGGEISGTYASVAVIAKFVVFIGLAAETVLLPQLFSDQPTRSQIGTIIGGLWIFGLISVIGSYLVGAHVLNLLKPGLGIHQPLLVGAIIINRCFLTLSISSKALTNHGSRVPGRVIGVGCVLWYMISIHQSDLVGYIEMSIVVLMAITVMMQGYRLYSGKRSQNLSL